MKLCGYVSIKIAFLMKIRMVCMAHRNVFYNTDCKIVHPKTQLGGKVDFQGAGKLQNSVLRFKCMGFEIGYEIVGSRPSHSISLVELI